MVFIEAVSAKKQRSFGTKNPPTFLNVRVWIFYMLKNLSRYNLINVTDIIG